MSQNSEKESRKWWVKQYSWMIGIGRVEIGHGSRALFASKNSL